jgi:capsular exopolysaccharide synthesis family protein
MDNRFLNLRNIEPFSLIKDLIRGFWIVLMVAAVGVMVSHAYITASYVPEYTSSSIYVVTPKQSTGYVYLNKQFAKNVVTVFQNLMNSDIMNNKIKKDLHISKMDANVNISLIEETNLMKISVTSTDPILSFKTIGAIMDNYASLSEYLDSDAVFETLEAPVVATSPNNALMPRKKSIMAGIICGFVTLLILAAISILRKTIKTESVVEEQLDTTLLGTIYHERKNRTVKARIVQSVKALLITSPIISTKFIEAFNSIRIKIEYEHERRPEKNVVLVSSVCENEGKSTVAINIALSLVKEGKKVIVIDADMRKPAMYKMLDIPKRDVVDIIKLLQGECGLDEVMYHDEIGLDLIMPTRGHASTYEFMKSGAMSDLIKKCSRIADYVIVDTPPMSMVSDTEALADKVDFSLLVIRQDYSYEKDVSNCINIMNDSNSKFLGCILNDYKIFKMNDRNSVFSMLEDKEVEIYGE